MASARHRFASLWIDLWTRWGQLGVSLWTAGAGSVDINSDQDQLSAKMAPHVVDKDFLDGWPLLLILRVGRARGWTGPRSGGRG